MKKSCGVSMVIKVLVIIGAINWGLMGLGDLLGGRNLNVVNLILKNWPMVEAIVYVLVGIAGIMMIFGCRCKVCSSCKMEGGNCEVHADKVAM